MASHFQFAARMKPSIGSISITSPALVACALMTMCAAMFASTTLALPPLQPFPAATRPVDGGVLPADGRIFVFGGEAVLLDALGLSLSVDGRSVAIDVALIGCCTVSVTPASLLEAGGAVSLLVTKAGSDTTFSFSVGPVNDVAPTIGIPEVVQVVNATRLVAPMSPADGPAWIITLDIPGIADDTEVAAIATFAARDAADVVGGPIVTIEPPAGTAFERVITGVAGSEAQSAREGCFIVEVRDLSGNSARAPTVCTALPPPDARGDDDDDEAAGGCTSSSAPSVCALGAFVIAILARTRRALIARITLCGALATSCAGRDPRNLGAGICPDAIVDHTWRGELFDDAFFDQIAYEQYGWFAVKVIIFYPTQPEKRRVGFMDSEFYSLHDEWFYWRLANGVRVCGAEDIEPLADSPGFATVADIQEWARTAERLPPFISWLERPNNEPRLMAPDFYRLARETEPRVYAPIYLTRDVPDEPRAYVLRIAPSDLITREELAANFAALDPLMPDGAPLYWKPSRNQPAHQALVAELDSTNDPLATRIIR